MKSIFPFISSKAFSRFLLGSLFLSFGLFANPKNGEVQTGLASFSEDQNRLTISQSSDKAVIDWKDFSIGKNEITEFIQPTSFSAVLNRVMGLEKSVIEGMLQANGKVLLVNPQGVIVTKDGSIATKSFLVTTLNVQTEDFLNGKDLSLSGDSDHKIENFGTIESSEGNIFLIAREVENYGDILAKDRATLIGAQEVLLVAEGQKAFVRMPTTGKVCNEGIVKAAQIEMKAAGGNMFSYAVSNKGMIEAKALSSENGKIILKGESNKTLVEGSLVADSGVIHVLGEDIELLDGSMIDVSGDYQGGTVLVGGDYQGKNPLIPNAKNLIVEKDAKIFASAKEKGNGGKTIFWGDDSIAFFGSVKAEGRGKEHEGGFVEISSKEAWHYSGCVSTTCEEGKTGTLLFDPYNININANPTANMTNDGGSPTRTYTATSNPGTFNVGDLVTALGSNNIIVSTAGAGGFAGSLVMSAPLSWASGNSLELRADSICATTAAITMGGDLTLTSLTNVVSTSALISSSGPYKFTINAAGQVAVSGGITHTYAGAALPVSIDITAQTSPGTTTGFDLTSNITATNGDINIAGTSYGSGGNETGVRVNTSGGIFSVGTGANAAKINLTGNTLTGAGGSVSGIYVRGAVSTIDGDVVFNGTSAAPGNFGKGIRFDPSASLSSTGLGTLTLNGNVTGSSSGGIGIDLVGASATVSTTMSNITFNGTATGGITATSTTGVVVNASSGGITSTSGDITIVAAGNNRGLSLNNGSIASVSGDVDITGTRVTGSNGITLGSNGSIGSGSMTGDIYVRADRLSLSSSGSIQGTGTSDIYLLPTTTGSSIGIGNLSTGTFILTDGIVTTLVNGFNSINIGINGTGTHVVDINPFLATLAFNDSLNIFGQNITVASGKTLSAPDATFNVGQSGAVSFTLSGTVTPTVGTFTVNGGAGNDTFSIPSASQAVTINGQGGTTNKLIGANATKTWTINPANAGSVSSITFSNIQSCDGGSGSDTFSFGDNVGLSGAINGGGGINTLDYSSYSATAVTVDYSGGTATNVTGGVSNCRNVVAGQVANTLTGANGVNNQFEFQSLPSNSSVTGNSSAAAGNTIFMNFVGANAFSITGADNAGTINPLPNQISFTGIGNLIGGGGNDSFAFVGARALTGTTGINGGGGTNSFTGPAVDTTFTPNTSSDDQGTLFPTGASGSTPYQNIASIAGGSTLDTIDYSAFGVGVTVNLSTNSAFRFTGSVTGIDKIIAGTSTNSLTGAAGADNYFEFQTTPGASMVMGNGTATAAGNQIIMNNAANNSYQITGNDAGTINSVILFSQVERLLGSSLNDTFTFNGLFQLSGIATVPIPNTAAIDGGSGGTNQIAGPATSYTFFTPDPTTNNKGTVEPNTSPGTTTYLNINSLTTSNSFSLIDYSAHATAVAVDFNTGSATNVNGGAASSISNIRRVRAGTGTNTLTGRNATINYFYFPSSSPGASVVNGNTSTGSGNFLIMEAATANNFAITGSNDAGNVNGAGVISYSQIGNLTGGAGNDTFTITGARRLTGTFGIDGGSAGTNTIVGPNVATTFTPNTSTDDQGSLLPTGAAGSTVYQNIDSITGGSAVDTIDYSSFAVPVTVDLSANSAFRYTGTVTSIERLIAGSSNNTLTGVNGVDNFFEFPVSPAISTVTGNTAATAAGNQLFMNVMTANTYNINAVGGGTINTAANQITFTGIGNLIGGMNNDEFTLAVGGQIAGTNGIQGGSGGSNKLTGPDEVATWAISADDTGDITPTTAGKTDFSSIQALEGGNGVDTFTFNGAFRIQNGINGGGSNSFVNAPNVNNAWSIIGSDQCTLTPTGASGLTTLTDVNHLVGGTANDSFTFNNAAQITGLPNAIDGGSASGNTITGPNVPNVWNISTSDNQGSINTNALGATTLFRIQQWTGGNAQDDFTFNGALRVDNGIDGAGGSNSVTGPNVDTTWTISSNEGGVMDPTGASGTTALTNLQTWTAGTGVDLFDYTGAYQLSGSPFGIDGGSGDNKIDGPDVATTWDITDDDEGSLTPTGAPGATDFTNIPNLTGGPTTSDTFVLQDQKGLTGKVDGGGSGAQNTLDYSNYSTPVSIDFINDAATNIFGGANGGIANFDNAAAGRGTLVGGGGDDVFRITSASGPSTVDGGGGTNTLIGPATGVNWTVDGSQTSNYSGFIDAPDVIFDNIQKITGGGGTDTFTMSSTGIMDLIDGTSGSDRIQAKDQDNTWNITENNAGNFPSVTSFVNIPNATGGNQNDIFVISDQKGMSGLVDGGSALDNVLDYSAYTTPVEVNIPAGTATNMGAITNFQDAIIPDIPVGDSERERRIFNTQLFTTLIYDRYENLGNYTIETKRMRRTIKPFDHMYWYKIEDLKVIERE